MLQRPTIRRLNRGEGRLFRQIRLQALKESPEAFGSTFKDALQRTEESWNEQADSTVQGSERATFLAFLDTQPVGISSLYRDREEKGKGHLIQVWIAPQLRGTSLANELFDAILNFARESQFQVIIAEVKQTNLRAIRFYDKLGFQETPTKQHTEDLLLFYPV